jgi:hypothetical protein
MGGMERQGKSPLVLVTRIFPDTLFLNANLKMLA